jgi:hypothetical protein
MKKVTLLLLTLAIAGCNDLKDVESELNKGGFVLWYPAESGVEPGQIWVTNGKQKDIRQMRPDQLELFGPNPATFKTLSKKVDAQMTLDTSFGEEILGEAGELAVVLKNATVENVELNFGKTRITRLVLGDIGNPEIRKTLPEGYLKDLEKVEKLPGYVLVSSVVTSSGMKFTFTCEDTKQLEAKVPEISKLIKGEFSLNIKNDKTASWEIPETDVLTIGTALVSGPTVRLTPKDVESRALNVRDALLKLKTVPLEQLLGADK